MNRAVDISVGSLSPTINWGTLKHQEFVVPPLNIQIALSRLLWKESEALESENEVDSKLGILRKTYMNKFRTPSSNWKKYKIKELMNFNYGRALKESDRIDGEYPVVSSSGIQGTHSSNFVEGPGVVVGRKGNVGETTWVEKDFWQPLTLIGALCSQYFRNMPIVLCMSATEYFMYLVETWDRRIKPAARANRT